MARRRSDPVQHKQNHVAEYATLPYPYLMSKPKKAVSQKKPAWETIVLALIAGVFGAGGVIYFANTSSSTQSKGSNSPVATIQNSSNATVNQGVQITVSSNQGPIGQIAGTIINNGSTNAPTKEDLVRLERAISDLGGNMPSLARLNTTYPLGYVIFGLKSFSVGGKPYANTVKPGEIEIEWDSSRLSTTEYGKFEITPPSVRFKFTATNVTPTGPVTMTRELFVHGNSFEFKRAEPLKVRALEVAGYKMDLEVLASGSDSAIAVAGFLKE